MDASGLPIPALIAALRSGTPPQVMDVDAVAAAMNIVVDRLGLGGVRLELLDTGPLSPSQIHLGTPVAAEGGQRATVRGAAGNAALSASAPAQRVCTERPS